MRVVLLWLVVVALVTGCAGEAPPPEERLAQAAALTEGAGSARLAIESLTEMGEATGSRMTTVIQGEGSLDFAAERGRLVFELPFGGTDSTSETVFDGDVIYERVTEVAVGAGTGNEQEAGWFRHDGEDGWEDGPGSFFGDPSMSTDPAAVLQLLGAVDGTVETVGYEEVREAPTTHYRFTVSAAALAANAGLSEEDLDPAAPPASMGAWLDDGGRVRRTELVVDLDLFFPALPEDPELEDCFGDEELAPAGTVTTTIEWFDFGVPVEIAVPSGAEVMDFDDWLNEEFDDEEVIEDEPWDDEELAADLRDELAAEIGADQALAGRSDEELKELFGDDLSDELIERIRTDELSIDDLFELLDRVYGPAC